jgi:L-fuconolactonase
LEFHQVIDAHQHFWRYGPAEYEWIDDSMAGLRRDFLPLDLARTVSDTEVSGTIAVQARQTVAESEWLLKLAAENGLIRGVVGWAPIADPEFPALLEDLVSQSKLRGLRHVVQGEPDGFLGSHEFNDGIVALTKTGLVYDLLIVERQLPEAIEFVDRHPNQVFVLDHIAKPRIAAGLLEPWAKNIAELARRQNVYCKLSGMVTEADWNHWTTATLIPYVDVVLEAFTPRRLMFGSDWPVCTVATTYVHWIETLDRLLAGWSNDERERVFGGTAIEAYRLEGE